MADWQDPSHSKEQKYSVHLHLFPANMDRNEQQSSQLQPSDRYLLLAFVLLVNQQQKVQLKNRHQTDMQDMRV